jgi:hypothetical protein
MIDPTVRGQSVPSAADDPSSILTLGFDAASVRACLLEMVSGRCRLAAWSSAALRSDASLDIQAGELLQHLGDRLHRTLWNSDEGAPFVLSDEPTSYPPLGQIAAVASPSGQVRVWLAGLTATQSLAAAEEALAGGPAQIVGQTLHSADLQVGRLAAVLSRVELDLILLVGGYDYPAAEALQPLYELSRVFAAVLARTPPPQRPQVLFAGNRWAAAGVAEVFQAAGAGTVEIVENVRPAPGVLHRAGLVQAVNFAYWRLCRRNEGMREVSRWVTAPGHISSIESSFAQLVQVWMEQNDLPDLHALYCGPAWWLHVAARQDQQGLDLRYVAPNSRPDNWEGWPLLRLVSGDWPNNLWPRLAGSWWDRGAFAPLVAAVGQLAPQAMLQVLRADVLEPRT